MAYFEDLPSGKTRACIDLRGVRRSRAFTSKTAAREWATSEEAAILAGARGEFPGRTVAEAFTRYEKEISKRKRGARAEGLRFAAFLREFPWLAEKRIDAVTSDDLGKWRDARRAVVSDSSVVREAAQLRAVWTVAAREWKWCADPTPWRDAKLPAKGHARTRRFKWQEIKRIVRSAGYVTGQAPTTPQGQVAWAFLTALHTAMRAGEVLSLTRKSVNLGTAVSKLEFHKTMEIVGVRSVPMFPKARRFLRTLDDAAAAAGRDKYFTISAQSLDVLFRKVRDRVLVEGARFHDSRGDALTRMARRVDVMTLAKISGHKDLNQLLDAYYRETPEEIAERLSKKLK